MPFVFEHVPMIVPLPVAGSPSFNPAAGTYLVGQSVTLSAAPGTSIFYTLDGSFPNPSSPLYSGPITVGASQTIKAIATAVGFWQSPVSSAAYIIVIPASTPTFAPIAGTYTSAQSIVISCSTPSSIIFYTTDGSTPTTANAQYLTPIVVSASETIKAIATAPSFSQSAVGTATYTINTVAPAGLMKFGPGHYGLEGNGLYDTTPLQAYNTIKQMLADCATAGVSISSVYQGYEWGALWPSYEKTVVSTSPIYDHSTFWMIANLMAALWPTGKPSHRRSGNRYTNTNVTATQLMAASMGGGGNDGFFIPHAIQSCGGSLTVLDGFGLSTSKTYPVAAVASGSPNYGMNFQDVSGAVFKTVTPQWYNPGIAQMFINAEQSFWVSQGPPPTAWSAPTTYSLGLQSFVGANTYTYINPTASAGNVVTNTTFWALTDQRYVGKTPDQILWGSGFNDEVSNAFISGTNIAGITVNPPVSVTGGSPSITVSPTKEAFWTQYVRIQQGSRAGSPTTSTAPIPTFGWGAASSIDSPTNMAANWNANCPSGNRSSPVALSTIQGLALCAADTYGFDFNATTNRANNCKQGFYGIAVPGAAGGALPTPTVPNLIGKKRVISQVQAADYFFNVSGAGNNASAVQQVLAAGEILQSGEYRWCQIASTNNTGGVAHPVYLVPTLIANPLPAICMQRSIDDMASVTINSVTVASSTSLNVFYTPFVLDAAEQGLQYQLYINGVANGSPSTSGTLIATGLTTGATVVCSIGMTNGNGPGPQGPGFSATVGGRYLGINSNQLSYFTLEQPLLNIMKMAAVTAAFGNTGLCGNWLTSNVGTSETNEEPYLQLDSSGWPTSLVAGNGFGGVQQFTFAQTWIFSTLNPPNGYSALPPGASQWFPWNGITYQAQIQGAGTIKFVGASAITALTGGANLTISGTQIISTLGIGQTATISFTIGPNGLQLQVTAVNSTSNNIKIPYIVDQSQLAAYNAGEILSKNFKAAMTGRSTAKVFSCLRNLGLQNTTQQEYTLSFTGNLALNATTGTLSSLVVQGATYTTWPFYTGTRKVVFATGQVVNISGTFGAASVSWDVPLSAAVTTAAVGAMAMLSKTSGWSERTLVGDMTWAGTSGAPLEAIIQISNELGIDSWLLVPAMLPTVDSTYLPNLAALVFNGTGANIANWNVSSFAGLATAQRAYVEYSNETWNYGAHYEEAFFVTMMCVPAGFFAIQGQFYGSQEFHGVQTAGIGDAFFAVYGAAMTSRVGVVMMNQSGVGNGSGFMTIAMNTPDWTSRAYTHHIYGYGCAPYFGPTYIDGNSNMSSGDAGTIAALAAPVNELFSLAYTNHGASGNTYSSLPTNGYLGKALAGVTAYIAAFAGQPWQALPFVCYEGGLDVGNYSGNGAIGTSLTAMIRDIRAEYLNNDPTHLLSASGTGYLPGLKANGVAFINTLGTAGIEWGQFEVLTQIESMPPYTNAPRYFGDYNFATGN